MFINKIARIKFFKLWDAIDNAEVVPPCQETDPDLWFREGDKQTYRIARTFCNRCPVRVQCLDYAITNQEPAGMWGGKSPAERIKLKHDRKRKKSPQP
jgi:WhiB family redox-sensing transcriptional regulator